MNKCVDLENNDLSTKSDNIVLEVQPNFVSLGEKMVNRINFYYESLGFDLGLVDEDDRANVSIHPPIEGEKHYDSLIQFNGEMNIKTGDIMMWWLLIAPLLYVVLIENRKFFEEE